MISSNEVQPHKSAREPGTLAFLNTRQLAELLGVAESTVTLWRQQGTGPGFHKIGRRVVYSRADIDAWLASNRKGGQG